MSGNTIYPGFIESSLINDLKKMIKILISTGILKLEQEKKHQNYLILI